MWAAPRQCGVWARCGATSCRRYSDGSGVGRAARVFTLGRGESGQLGCGDLVSSSVPREVDVPCSGAVVTVAAGMNHTACVSNAGELWTFGSNMSQQLGHDEHSGVFTVFEEDQMLPGMVQSLDGAVGTAACGWYHTLVAGSGSTEAVLSGDGFGSLHSWGSSAWGQLGTGELTNVGTPTGVLLPVEPAQQEDGSLRAANPLCTAVACGGGHSLALTKDHRVLAWGNNSHGQLGTATCTHEYQPVFSPGLCSHGPVKAVAAGAFHSVAMLAGDGGHDTGTGVVQCGVPNQVQPDPIHPYMMDDLLYTDETMGTVRIICRSIVSRSRSSTVPASFSSTIHASCGLFPHSWMYRCSAQSLS